MNSKIKSGDRSISPYGKIAIIKPEHLSALEIFVADCTKDEARQLIRILEHAKIIEDSDFSSGTGFLAEAEGHRITGGPVTVAVWTRKDRDEWRMTGETNIIFIGWDNAAIAYAIETEWKDYESMMQCIKLHLKNVITPKPFWSAGETAAELSYSCQWIHKLASHSKIPKAFKNSSGWQIPFAWIVERKTKGRPKVGRKGKVND